jgi:integrase
LACLGVRSSPRSGTLRARLIGLTVWLVADGKPRLRVEPLGMIEVRELLVALQPVPGPRVEPLGMTEVRVSLHGRSVCQRAATVLDRRWNHITSLEDRLSIAQVYALADATGVRYRALVLLACFCGLRWGELAALRRCDLDIATATVRIARQLNEVSGQLTFGPPKTDAGKRNVIIPPMILPDICDHLESHVRPAPNAPVFVSPAGTPLRHSNFYRRTWLPALRTVGLSGVHFHDLRHAGNQLVANAGANLRELMERMGHSSSRAALIYLHSTDDRQRTLAAAVADRARAELGEVNSRGTSVARTARANADDS